MQRTSIFGHLCHQKTCCGKRKSWVRMSRCLGGGADSQPTTLPWAGTGYLIHVMCMMDVRPVARNAPRLVFFFLSLFTVEDGKAAVRIVQRLLGAVLSKKQIVHTSLLPLSVIKVLVTCFAPCTVYFKHSLTSPQCIGSRVAQLVGAQDFLKPKSRRPVHGLPFPNRITESASINNVSCLF